MGQTKKRFGFANITTRVVPFNELVVMFRFISVTRNIPSNAICRTFTSTSPHAGPKPWWRGSGGGRKYLSGKGYVALGAVYLAIDILGTSYIIEHNPENELAVELLKLSEGTLMSTVFDTTRGFLRKMGLGYDSDSSQYKVRAGAREFKVKDDGHAKEYYEDGTTLKFEGNYIQGKKEGEGSVYYPNGKMQYKGGFKEGRPHGYGKHYYRDFFGGKYGGCVKYEGGYVQGQMEGEGSFYFPNGKLLYKGNFKDGKPLNFVSQSQSKPKEGKQQSTPTPLHSSSSIFSTTYTSQYHTNGNLAFTGYVTADGVRYGYGKGYNEDGILVYDGHWKNNQFEGKGSAYYVNGSLEYNGMWKDDQPHGYGAHYNDDGTLICQGQWTHGQSHKIKH